MPLPALLLAATLAVVPGPPVRRGITGFPRIVHPTGAAQRRINVALARMEATTRRSAHDCLDGGGNPTSWDRRVVATMRGPAFLSYAIEDEVDCGGAHPDEEHGAIVYDLATGAPVDWAALLPARLHGTLALSRNSDGVRFVTLAAPRLSRLYAAGYRRLVAERTVDAECDGAGDLAGEEQPMLAWLDGRRGALVVQFDLGHAAQNCSAPVAISAETLAREGASSRLVAALQQARTARR